MKQVTGTIKIISQKTAGLVLIEYEDKWFNAIDNLKESIIKDLKKGMQVTLDLNEKGLVEDYNFDDNKIKVTEELRKGMGVLEEKPRDNRTQILIARQVALKCASELKLNISISRPNELSSLIILLAEEFEKWIMRD